MYRIEYYAQSNGRTPVREWIDTLPLHAQVKVWNYTKRYAVQGGAAGTHIARKLTLGIHELRPEYGGIEYRILFGIVGDRMVLVHAVAKTRESLLRSDIDLALKRVAEVRDATPKKRRSA